MMAVSVEASFASIKVLVEILALYSKADSRSGDIGVGGVKTGTGTSGTGAATGETGAGTVLGAACGIGAVGAGDGVDEAGGIGKDTFGLVHIADSICERRGSIEGIIAVILWAASGFCTTLATSGVQ
jgi:hypothetical protein